jgi:DNA-3-methyladenine glycosylase I
MRDGVHVGADGKRRCAWISEADPAAVAYHDRVWGTATRDVRAMFESLTLGVFEVGLNWSLVFHKRDAFAAAFADFHPERVAKFGVRDVDRLTKDAAIIRNRRKIEATVANAKAIAAAPDEFVELAWSHARGRHQTPKLLADIPSATDEAKALSDELRARGFRFIGPTSAYAFMQNVGIVNDHLRGCFRATAH